MVRAVSRPRQQSQAMSMISAAASTNRPRNSREPAEISLLSDFTFLSI